MAIPDCHWSNAWGRVRLFWCPGRVPLGDASSVATGFCEMRPSKKCSLKPFSKCLFYCIVCIGWSRMPFSMQLLMHHLQH